MELFGIVDGKDVTPVRAADEAQAVFEKRLAEWNKRDMQAQRVIVSTIDDQPLTIIMTCLKAAEMWKKLSDIYDQNNEVSIHLLQQSFYKFSMNVNEDIATNISRIQDMANKMKRLGENLSEGMVITKILMTLPESYSNFISAWESTSIENRTLESLTARLLTEESRRSTTEKPVALSSSRVKYSKDKNKVICFICRKPGHLKKNCFFNKNKSKSNQKSAGQSSEREAMVATEYTSYGDERDYWYLDSGASDHMTSRREWFSTYEQFSNPLLVKIGNGTIIEAIGKGSINIRSNTFNEVIECCLNNVLYVPELKMNLFSSGATMDRGFEMYTDYNKCILRKEKKIMAVGFRFKKLYKMSISVECVEGQCSSMVASGVDKFALWHERLGHQNSAYVQRVCKQNNINLVMDQNFFCESCVYGKQHKLPFENSKSFTKKVGELIHLDLCGPMQVNSVGNARYFFLIKDDFSGYRVAYMISKKDQVAEKFSEFLNKLHNETGKRVLKIRSDNGKEFVNQFLSKICNDFNIQHQTTVEYTPEQNGKIERENRTVIEMVRTLLHSRNLNLKFWGEAVNTAVYIINRTFLTGKTNKTPYELWHGKVPDIHHLRIFGSVVYSHIPKQKRQKFDKKSEKGIFLGYGELTKGYRIWYENEKQVKIRRDVIFDEAYDNSNSKKEKDEHEDENEEKVILDMNQLMSNTLPSNSLPETNIQMDQSRDQSVDRSADGSETFLIDESTISEEGGRISPYELRPRHDDINYCALLTECMEPQSYEDAIRSNESKLWCNAMEDEYKSLITNKTWELTERPQKNILRNRWVYRIKRGSNNKIERYKARLVVKGFQQIEGLDYVETFAPVVRFDSVRLILAIAASEDMKLRQFDVKTAFLHGSLDEEIYMEQPIGFTDNTDKVCRLLKSLYGLKQASRKWNERFLDFIKKMNFEISKVDPCVFIKREDGSLTLMTIYVDDGLIASNDRLVIDIISKQLEKEFEVKIGEVNCYLGLEIRRNEKGSYICDQKSYIDKLLRKYGMENSRPVATPIDSNKHEETCDKSFNFKYREAVGCLLYLATVSRPDIAFAVSFASRYIEKPLSCHFVLVKRILRYLRGSLDLHFEYRCKQNFELNCYSDSDFAGDIDSRRSTSGFVVCFGRSTISWCSQKQKIVALSTTEAEYIAACEAIKQVVWYKQLLEDFGYNIKYNLFLDNQSSIRIIKNPEFHKRTKHIDVRYHYIRDMYNSKFFEIYYVPTNENLADFLTKPLVKLKFIELIRFVMTGFREDVDLESSHNKHLI